MVDLISRSNFNMQNEFENDFPLYSDASQMFSPEELPNLNMTNFNMDPNTYPYQHSAQEYSHPTYQQQMYSELPVFAQGKQSPGPYAMGSPDTRVPPSNFSTASGPSAASSAMGSPYSNHGHAAMPEFISQGMGAGPTIMEQDYNSFGGSQEYQFASSGMENDYFADIKPGFVDPSLIHGFQAAPIMAPIDGPTYHQSIYPPPVSPALSQRSSQSSRPIRHGSHSPFYHPYPYAAAAAGRRPSLISRNSYGSQEGSYSGDDSREKNQCPRPDCGKTFKDLKAHMLTHEEQRPEKCPITICDYHIKGFARKYDKNRHTLTHYKGTMVCGFCPGSGSAAEKSFNRADVFKRHLTSVHAVEQTAPNSRKKSSPSNAKKLLSGYAPDATGKCSTCSAMFTSAQDFYEHLDDCVLRIVQQEEPSEAINAKRLAEVENDPLVLETLRNNGLPTTTINNQSFDGDEEDDDEDSIEDGDDEYTTKKARKGPKFSGRSAIQKSRGTGLTLSKGGVQLQAKVGRKKRRDFPTSWGCPQPQMKMKKRVMCAFDGPRRLWKDDMMLSTEFEVRLPLQDGKSYVTDLDVQTIRRAGAFHNATDEEKGWDGELIKNVEYPNESNTLDLEKLMEVKSEAHSPDFEHFESY